jgi:hypothetical protein
VAAIRPKITAPDMTINWSIDPIRVIESKPDPAELPSGNAGMRVPPVPGYDPVATPGSPEFGGSSGAPRPVPAVPGQPVSMLPIPPGSPYAPVGGAYVLPGPGVGSRRLRGADPTSIRSWRGCCRAADTATANSVFGWDGHSSRNGANARGGRSWRSWRWPRGAVSSVQHRVAGRLGSTASDQSRSG